MANVDNLNFKVILDDKEFNTKVRKDIKLAQDLNTRLSNLLQVKAKLTNISAQEAASAKRASDILAKQAIDQERVRKAAALAAEAEERKVTALQRTVTEIERTKAASNAAAANAQRLATEFKRTEAATKASAVQSQRLKTETQRTATEVQRTATATQNTANATARAELAQRRLRDYSSQTTRQVQVQSRLMQELKGYALGYLSIHGATQLLSSLVRVTGEFELQKTTLAAMLGDLNKAEQVISRIQALAVESPFQFKELTTYAKQLSAFSVPAEELFETTKMLADISAGLGVGMDRIVLAYGQVRSAAFLRGQEVRQFTEAGIPILDELAKQFSELEGRAVSTGEVFDKISARLVPFEMVAKVMKDLTSEGGKFYNMQEVQAETLRGKISNLRDAYEVMLNEIGSQRSGSMKGAVDSVRRLMQNWEKVGAILKTVIVTYGAYKATLGAIWAVEKAIGAIRSVQLYQLLTTERNVKKATAAYKAFGLTLKQIKKMGAGIAVGAILGLVTVISTAIKRAGELKRELESIMNSEVSGSSKMLRDLDRLVGNLSEAKKGSQNYREAISELNRKYGEYLPNILTEADNYEKVKAAADSAAQAIRNKAKASAFEKGSAAIEDDFGKKLTKREKALREALEQLDPSLGGEYATEFMQNFKVALAKEGGNLDVLKTFKESFDAYFGEGTYEKFTAKYLKPAALEDAATGYAKILGKVQKEEEKLEEQLKLRFSGAEFTSKEEREKMSELNTWYKNQVDSLKELELKQADYNERLGSLKIEKLQRLVTIYDELGRPELAKQFQSQLDALTKIPEGWRGTVQGVLKGMGLNKGTSFGLWAEDTTQSTSYVEDMIKRYKELGEEIKWVSSFDTDQAERLKKNKAAIEAIAKELGILDLLTEKQDSKREKTETDYRIRALKREAEVIKEAMETYEEWMDSGFFTDDVARELLGKIYGDTQAFKEGVTTYTKGMVEALKESERLVLKVYQNKLKDKNGKEYLDVPTAGWGHTGKDVSKLVVGTAITKEQADRWLQEDLQRLTGDLNDVLREFGVSLNQAQYDALAHMVFNTGKGGITDLFKKSLDEFGKVDLNKVAENIPTHRTNNGTKALIDRRAKEYAMFTKDIGIAVSEDGKLMTNFDEMLNKVILRLQALGEKGKEAAAVLQSAFDKSSRKEEANDVYKSYEKQYKAVSKYYEMLRKWSSEDFNLNGEGIVLDVSKIASDLNGKIREIELRATKAKELFAKIDKDSEEEIAKVKEIFVKEFGADAWTDFWTSYQQDGIKAIENLADKQKEYEKKLAQEKVNDLAEKYVKESYFDNNIELTDLGDKNFFQLRALRKKLQDLLEKEPLKIPVEIEQMLSKEGINTSDLTNRTLDDAFFKGLESEYGQTISDADMSVLRLVQSIQKAKLSTTDFGKTIKKVIGGDLKNLTEEEAEAFMSMVKSYMGDVQDMMSSVASYAEAIGSEELQGAVNGLAEAMDILGSMADRLAKGDWIGAIISGITSLASTIMEAVTQEYALNDAIAQTRNEIALLNSQKRINGGVESIFGDDEYKRFQNAYDEVVSAHAKAIDDIEKQNQLFHGRSKDNWGTVGVAGSLAAGAGLGAAVGSIFPVIGTAIGAGVGALVGMVVGLVGHAATEANDYAKSLQQMADEIGVELIDATTGAFDVEALKSIKNTYSDLDKEYQQMLDNLITNAEIFENAVTEMATFMTDIFGQCADDMADSFINAFKESGQAALEYGDIMSNLATDIARSVIKSTIIDKVFDDEDAKAAAVKLAQGDLGGSMAIIEEAMQAAQNLSPYIQGLLEGLKPYFDMGDMAGQSLGDGIKGITEDTANLLASYLNAIRADVSYARTIWERMDATTQRIASILVEFSAPSLMEYQAQIAANTYNTMIATQSILSKLDAVVTYSDGPAGVRVYS
jgi:GH24 family phage-related lysozyme (muramidase)/uncharacterized membrane protein